MREMLEEPIVRQPVDVKQQIADLLARVDAVAEHTGEALGRAVPEVDRAIRHAVKASGEWTEQVRRETQANPIRSIGVALAVGATIGSIVAILACAGRRRDVVPGMGR